MGEIHHYTVGGLSVAERRSDLSEVDLSLEVRGHLARGSVRARRGAGRAAIKPEETVPEDSIKTLVTSQDSD